MSFDSKFFHFIKTQPKIFSVFNEQLNVNWLGHRFRANFCAIFFVQIFPFCLYLFFFLQSYHISWIVKGRNRSLWRYKRISQSSHLMHNVSNQFFSKKQCFNKFCPFAHFLSTCYHVALRILSILCSNKVQINFLSISFI